ncbi:hypothetical protein M2404_003887 [Rheinheimera pacifica]|uniref:hypothetical protein n=1 Tax=Rheinheimera pacifica TaxID=173990 RepID=UPI0021678B21|nr:hypothetical protein [Rheinheimera pacifica]MCS4309515.1 hypothetical protein [Rheinheimera pacifica]
MINAKSQRGFAMIVSTLVTLTIMSFIFIMLSQRFQSQRIVSEAEAFREHILYLKEQVTSFQADKVSSGIGGNGLLWFPASWAELEPAYVPACSTADNNAGRCRKASQTPWGATMSLTRQLMPTTGNYRLVITIPFPVLSDATRFEHSAYRSALSLVPAATWSDATNQLTVYFDRIGQELQHTALVKRSGDESTLTGDWDVGGAYSVVNARDITIRGAAGSQRSLASGVIRSLVARHGDRVNKPDCPSGLSPDVVTSIKGLYNQSIPNRFESVSASRAYHVNSTTYWTVGLDYYAKVEGEWRLLHDGEVNVSLLCV